MRDDLHSALQRHVQHTFQHRTTPAIRLALFKHAEGNKLVLSAHHLLADGGGIKALANMLGAQLYGISPRWPVGQNRGLLQTMRGLRWRDLPVLLAEMAREALQPLYLLRLPPFQHTFEQDETGQAPRWQTIFWESEATQRLIRSSHEQCTLRLTYLIDPASNFLVTSVTIHEDFVSDPHLANL